MIGKVFFTREAELDLLDSYQWYEQLRKGLGEELILSVENCLHMIAEYPQHFQFRYRNVRVAFIDRFPFGIHFLTAEGNIHVLGVFHMSRSPQNWDERTRE